ncbi:TerD family protein [Nocardia sp. NBC_01327]|uniref:TerD family protein n=1 Tax=Nocardia sp. NBC_01327 TaxID=2903593 RepID=UPI002E1038C2|nr:TerD family protein [Nocardia sp. NBC_01327]
MAAALLTQGQAGELGLAELVVTVFHSARVDLAALLLTARGRVRSDEDLVFYNQPAGPGVRLIPGQTSLAINLREIPADIGFIRIVLALDDRNAHFNDYPPPHLTIADAQANPLYEYVIEGLGPESTLVALDLDRTGDGWQTRAVGHGYVSGFAALVAAHAVSIGNTSPTAQPTEPAWSAVLQPGQDVALRTHGGKELANVKLALGWDPVHVQSRWGSRPAEIDLDASALVFAGNDLIDAAFYGQLSTRDGAIRHSGDNLTGEGKGDNEVITVDLTRLPMRATAIVFVITSYAGHTFERVRNAFWRLIDGSSSAELTRANLSAGGPHTGMVVAKVHRQDGVWKIQSLGQPIQAGHPIEAVTQVVPFL